jgi:transposase
MDFTISGLRSKERIASSGLARTASMDLRAHGFSFGGASHRLNSASLERVPKRRNREGIPKRHMMWAFVSGQSRHEVARMFDVSASCVIKLMQRVDATGDCQPRKFGGHKRYALAEHEDKVRGLVLAKRSTRIFTTCRQKRAYSRESGVGGRKISSKALPGSCASAPNCSWQQRFGLRVAGAKDPLNPNRLRVTPLVPRDAAVGERRCNNSK